MTVQIRWLALSLVLLQSLGLPTAVGATEMIRVTGRATIEPQGQDAAEREAEILNQFSRDRYYGPDILVSAGNTELFTHDVLGLDMGDHEHDRSAVNADAKLISRPIQGDFGFR